MQITITVAGRFHVFYLADRLIRKGVFVRIITTYPKFAMKGYAIAHKCVDSEVLIECLVRLCNMAPYSLNRILATDFVLGEIFDRIAAAKLKKSDLCISWSGCALHTLKKARQLGIKSILERGSSHMVWQQRIRQEEAGRWKAEFQAAHPRLVEKEIREYELADYIEVPSSYALDTFKESGVDPSKVIKSFRGVDPEEFPRLPKNDDVFRVICAGNISLRKGIPYLLKAFSQARLPNSELWLIGSLNPDTRRILAEYRDSFRWIPHQPQGLLHRYYSQGSVFVMPSIDEGMAVVQLQAMCCGLPLVCTTNTGGSDIIRDGMEGFVIPIRDEQVLKEKLIYLYENRSACQAMGERARERVISSFTWDHYVEYMLSHYRAISNAD